MTTMTWNNLPAAMRLFAFATCLLGLPLDVQAAVPAGVVINEIHFKPADESTEGEFIELFNPAADPVDISGWKFTSAITYTFPSGTTIAPGAYLVIALDPANVDAAYGITGTLGPWSGGLSSSGETLNLTDAAGLVQDSVTYGVGFPWPSKPDGEGPSIERINPALDSALSSSWRASGYTSATTAPTPLVAAGATDWHYLIGTAEASDPVSAWRLSDFTETDWSSGKAPLGYGESWIATTIPTLPSTSAACVFLRKTFEVTTLPGGKDLEVTFTVDDGCVIWLNGHELTRANLADGELPYSTLATNQTAEGVAVTVVVENGANYLTTGTNVLAVQVFNSALASSDLAIDVALASTTATTPTPGRANSVFRATTAVPPQIDSVAHTPVSPASGQDVTVSAHITDADGVDASAVTLSYQLVDPGAYIRHTDAAYATSWTTVPMALTGTDTYSATLPGSLQTNRRLVRYRINYADTLGNAETAPYADDAQGNFAYFVYDGVPDWQAAFRPASASNPTPVQTFPSSLLTSIPVYTLVAADGDVLKAQYNSSYNKVRFPGTFVYDGVVYDNVQFRNRGEYSTYVSGKNKWKIHFNYARRMQAKDVNGVPYKETWKQLPINSCASPWAALNRGASGLDEAIPMRAFQLAGMAAPNMHPFHFRIVRTATEAPATGTLVTDTLAGGSFDGQYAGDFWGLYLAVEPMKGNFIDEHNLPDGNLYQIEADVGELEEQAAGMPSDSSDWIAFRNAQKNTNPTEAWWRENLDLEAFYTFHAINRLTGNIDVRGNYNHYYLHRVSDNRWTPIPWDLDMMFIAKSHQPTTIAGVSVPGVIYAYKAIVQQPAIALEYRNRGREILDLLASDASTTGGQVGQLVAELSAPLHTAGSTLTWAWADAAKWNLHPRTAGSDSATSFAQSNHKGNFFRSPYNDSRIGGNWTAWLRDPAFAGTGAPEDIWNRFRDYICNTWPGATAWAVNNGDQRGYGYQYLLSEVADADIPARPTIAYSGVEGYPANQLRFSASAFDDPQGAATFAARQWRIAEIGAKGAFELKALWTTETTDAATAEVRFPTSVVKAGHTYRARVRQKDATGRWSHWSEPVTFVAAAETPSTLVHYWNFNDGANLLAPTRGPGSMATASTNPSTVFYSGTGKNFAGENAQLGDAAGSHLRIDFPNGATVTWNLPTSGFEDVVVRIESSRSSTGGALQAWSYTLDGGTTWIPKLTFVPLADDPEIVELDFRDTAGAANNPLFGVRVEISQGIGGTAGNDRMDDLTLTAQPMPGSNQAPTAASTFPTVLTATEGGGTLTVQLADLFTDPEGESLTFTATSGNGTLLNVSRTGGTLTLSGLARGEATVTVTAKDSINDIVSGTFSVLIYPQPHVLSASSTGFSSWSADASECTYPEHMLFLQGIENDCTLATVLNHAYHIPSADYAAADSANVGFPYRNTSRTRINGLGDDGVAFINTGRARDLGGVLLALDTRNVTEARLAFDAGTVLPNTRVYAWRLQYRIGTTGDFADLTDGSGQPIEYVRNETAGHAQAFGPIALPPALLGQECVHLLWRYHLVSGDSGSRAQLRLDDIQVRPIRHSYAEWRAAVFSTEEAANDAVSGPAAVGPDNVSNLMRYAMGIDRTTPAADHLPRVRRDADGQHRYAFLMDKASQSDLSWTVRASTDLSSWTTVLFDSTVHTPVTDADGWTIVTLPADPSSLFLKLEVSALPPP